MVVAELFGKLGLIPDEHQWEHGHELVESLHHALEAYLGVEALKKVHEMIEGTVEAAVQVKHLGERLGITGEAVQELGFAADVTGASQEDLTSGLQRLSLGLEHAKKGTGPLVDAMRQLHVPISNLRHEKLDQNLEEIADGFKNAGPHVDKLALSIEIFGRNAGPKLIPLLEKGSDGIKDLREEAQKLGVVIDEDGIEKAEEFEIAQKKLGYTLKGLRNEAVIAILPALQEMAEGLSKWIAENHEAIESGLEGVLHGVAVAFKLVGEVIVEVTDFFKEHHDTAMAILTALGAAMAVFAINAAADWLIALGPLALVPAIIFGIIELVDHWGEIWHTVTSAIRNAIKRVAADWLIMLGPLAILPAIIYGIIELVSHWGEIWHTVTSSIRNAVETAFDAIKRVAEDAAQYLIGMPIQILEAFDGIGQGIIDAFGRAWDYIRNEANELWDDIKDIPVIGRLASGIEALTAEPSGSLFAAGGPALVTAGGGDDNSTTLTATFGDVHVHAATGTDPGEQASEIARQVKEAQKDMIRQAVDAVKGGKK